MAAAAPLPKYPLGRIALAAIAGIVMAETIPTVGYGLVLGALVAAAGGVLSYWKRPLGLLAVAFGVFALAHGIGRRAAAELPLLDEISEFGSLLVECDARVVSFGPSASGSTGRWSYLIRANRLSVPGDDRDVSKKLRLICSDEELRYGDRIIVSGSFRRPPKSRNPGAFDPNLYLARQGVSAEIVAGRDAEVEVASPGLLAIPFQAAARCRGWIAEQITRGLDPEGEPSAVLKSMTLGDRADARSDLILRFRESGTLHLFAVSGLHVGIVASVCWILLTPFRLRRSHAILLIIPLIIGYAFVTGLRPSAVRAAVMLSLVLGGIWCNREAQIFNSLGAAALIILAFDTSQIFAIGFQLSFCVLGAIALLTPVFQKLYRRWVTPDPFLPQSLVPERTRWWMRQRRWVLDLAAVSTAAWLGSAPLSLAYFNLVTPTAVIANLILVPLAFSVIFTAAISTVLGLLFLKPLTIFVNAINAFLVTVITSVVGFFAALPGGHFYVELPDFGRSDGGGAAVRLTVGDIPQGGAANLLHTGGRDILIDVGHGNTAGSILKPILASRGIDSPDAVVLSHEDSQHIGGAGWLLRNHPSAEVYWTVGSSRSANVRDILETVEEQGVDLIDLDTATSSPTLASLEVLYPPPEGLPRASRADDRCAVIAVDLEGWRILLMGDAGFATERWLMQTGADIRADVVVKGQHSTDYSGLPGFISATGARAVVYTSQPFPEGERPPPWWEESMREKMILLFKQSIHGAVELVPLNGGESLKISGYLSGYEVELRRE